MLDVLRRLAIRVVCLLSCISVCGPQRSEAISYNFDLTTEIDANLANAADVPIDLGVEFLQVDSISILLAGNFRPGLVTGVTVPELSGPIFESDTVNLIVRLGEVGTAWINKSAYAIQALQGFSGTVSFSLPLQSVAPTSSTVFLPSGSDVPDFSFLVDSRFAISAGWSHYLLTAYHELQPPQFELSSFVLRVDGTAIPEPSTIFLAIAAFALLPPSPSLNRPHNSLSVVAERPGRCRVARE
jgi:hypothetical protein